jgi:hypothetical protein
MATYRTEKNKDNPFVMVDKFFIKDDRLSWKAKGLMVYFLSLPDDWEVYESEVTKHAGDGLRSTRSGIKELIEAGYIIRQRVRDGGQFKGYEYTVYEHPTVMPKRQNAKQQNAKQHTTNNDLTNNDLTNYKDKGVVNNSPSPSQNLDNVDNSQTEVQQMIAYYLAKYQEVTGEEHPRLKKAQWERIKGVLSYFAYENSIEVDHMQAMIDHHFERSLEHDGNINFFASEGILQNIFYEVLY